MQVVLKHGDVWLIEPLLPEIKSKYGKLTDRLQVQITMDHKMRLPDTRVGGIMVSARNRMVFVDNTLAVASSTGQTSAYRSCGPNCSMIVTVVVMVTVIIVNVIELMAMVMMIVTVTVMVMMINT